MNDALMAVNDRRELIYRLLFARGFCEAHPETGYHGWQRVIDGDPAALDELMTRIRRDVPRTPDEIEQGVQSRLVSDLARPFAGQVEPRLLRAGLEHADKLWTQARTSVAGVDVLGMAFEILDAHAGSGQFFTPWNLAEMIATMTPAKPGDVVIDPACGSGRLLLAGLSHAYQQHGHQARSIWAYGVELDHRLAMIARWNMILAGHWQAMIVHGDGLAFQAGPFDVVWANPPFGK